MTDPKNALFTLETRLFVPYETFAGGYAGDKRGFSMQADSSARVHAIATLSPANAAIVNKQAYSDTSSGPRFLIGPKGTANAIPQIKMGSQEIVGGGARFQMHTSGSDPLVMGAPDVDAHADVSLSVKGNTLSVEARFSGDRFPASEFSLRDGAGHAVMLGGHMPDTPADLWTKAFGDRQRPIGTLKMEIELKQDGSYGRIKSAEFKGPDGQKLAALNGVSINQWNRTLGEELTPKGMPGPEKEQSRGVEAGKQMSKPGHGL